MLLDSPYIGVKMADQPGYRQFFVPFGKSVYVLRYRLHEEADALVVVRVWHGKKERK